MELVEIWFDQPPLWSFRSRTPHLGVTSTKPVLEVRSDASRTVADRQSQTLRKNPRINDDAVDAVAGSLREFGFRQPIVVDAEGVIVVGHGVPVVRGYRKVIQFIRSASDERDFRAMRSLNYEKLQGDRAHQHSLRINDQWRLIVEIKKSEPKNVIRVMGIEDYH